MSARKLLYIIPLASLCAACSPKASSTEATTVGTISAGPVLSRPTVRPGNSGNASYIPKATAFRMSGDYSRNVAITPGAGNTLLYYPAPSDISASSAPIELEGGWWLNRQGLSENSVFTSYTFSDYSQLPSTPSQETLLEAVIPGATVTQFVTLPYSITEADSHIPEINLFLKNL